MIVPVSVIIPHYNGEKFLPECLESIRQQTIKPAEIILVDDGSNQSSKLHLQKLENDVQVIYLEKNRGPGVARNEGVSASTQPYIAFLDSDDTWYPEKLEVQYKLMNAWPELDATHTNGRFFDVDKDIAFNPGTQRRVSVKHALTNYRLITPSIMMKRESFNRINGFDPKFRCTQDWEMHIRMVLAEYLIEFIPDTLVSIRRQGHGNHSSNWRCHLLGHLGIMFKHRRSYIKRLGIRRWLHQLAIELYRTGQLQNGTIGNVLKLPLKLGI